MEVSINREPPNGWFPIENPIRVDDLGIALFQETPISNLPCGAIAKLKPDLHHVRFVCRPFAFHWQVETWKPNWIWSRTAVFLCFSLAGSESCWMLLDVAGCCWKEEGFGDSTGHSFDGHRGHRFPWLQEEVLGALDDSCSAQRLQTQTWSLGKPNPQLGHFESC